MQLTAEFVEGVLARLNKQATQPEIFEGSAKQERADVAALFRHWTESDGRLPARQLAHLVSVVQKHIEFETTITTTGGRAEIHDTANHSQLWIHRRCSCALVVVGTRNSH